MAIMDARRVLIQEHAHHPYRPPISCTFTGLQPPIQTEPPPPRIPATAPPVPSPSALAPSGSRLAAAPAPPSHDNPRIVTGPSTPLLTPPPGHGVMLGRWSYESAFPDPCPQPENHPNEPEPHRPAAGDALFFRTNEFARAHVRTQHAQELRRPWDRTDPTTPRSKITKRTQEAADADPPRQRSPAQARTNPRTADPSDHTEYTNEFARMHERTRPTPPRSPAAATSW